MALYLQHAMVAILDLYTTIQWESWLSTCNMQWWLYLICALLSSGNHGSLPATCNGGYTRPIHNYSVGIMALYLQHAMVAILDLYTTIQWESWLSTCNMQWWLY
ncbi:hypothetical protein DPMN_116752 [Dreissena polymorpha]|uniref:Uncharacterized protein n=1 Tax=Dreissena polymorpha TaxID=45954 RepID=A0A9D4QTP3_DREPO|nr:hypothetical protein DPMN_116752 [Dreissena polymorpha]